MHDEVSSYVVIQLYCTPAEADAIRSVLTTKVAEFPEFANARIQLEQKAETDTLDSDALDPIGGGGVLIGYGRVSTIGRFWPLERAARHRVERSTRWQGVVSSRIEQCPGG
ncbi:hypothetical protein IU450_31285 [Nocardia abscessus]|uniref:hypothetical protein n=1 Tax=Nocardia abscessus TaxID=120957 RepID=UPI001892D999|nr:hypothetical protein [Nocardia abscessus]MBF6340344.1 hypothetical protein [Nocardia abscessus]